MNERLGSEDDAAERTGAPQQLTAAIDDVPIDPRRHAIDLGEERAKTSGSIRDRVDAVLEGACEERCAAFALVLQESHRGVPKLVDLVEERHQSIDTITEARARGLDLDDARGDLHGPSMPRNRRARPVLGIADHAPRAQIEGVLRDDVERRIPLPYEPPRPDGVTRRRWFALGDPQTSFDRLLGVLAANDLVAEHGQLRRDVGLLSIGDHFDFGPSGGPEIGHEGHLFLRWLAEHPPDQVVILAGNHDLARVQELACETEDSFAAARALGTEIRARGEGVEVIGLRETFARRHPNVPTPEIAARDYSGFSEAQRTLVQELLMSGRMRLGFAGVREGAPVLFTHAGVCAGDLEKLGLPLTADVVTIARALDEWLDARVARVAPRWRESFLEALDLAPLHVMGTTRREGGGLLYHRPSSPMRKGADLRWELDAHAPRRFDPRTLPLGLHQVCGHSGHKKCRTELDAWVTPRARERALGGRRTLRTDGTLVEYDLGVQAAREGEATLWLIDGEIDAVPVESYELLAFDGAVEAPVGARSV